MYREWKVDAIFQKNYEPSYVQVYSSLNKEMKNLKIKNFA